MIDDDLPDSFFGHAPSFWIEPRRSEQLWAWIAYGALQPLWWLVPMAWSDIEVNGWRSELFYWIASESYWQYERAKGRA